MNSILEFFMNSIKEYFMSWKLNKFSSEDVLVTYTIVPYLWKEWNKRIYDGQARICEKMYIYTDVMVFKFQFLKRVFQRVVCFSTGKHFPGTENNCNVFLLKTNIQTHNIFCF